ncbi:MAG TPA: single-stranded DNA-binding protein [Hyphomicrobiaceae bacterium]|jgi:single-strand DNA-binding protein
MTMNGIECAFIGRLGKDPELRHSQAGKPWLPLNIGVGEGESVQWITATAFNTKAEELAGTLKKGMTLYVEGRDLRLDSYTTQAGEQRHGLKAIATKIELLGEIGQRRPPKPKAPAESAPAAPVSGPADWQRPLDAGGGRRPADDAIPF